MDIESREKIWRKLCRLKASTPLKEFPFPLEALPSDMHSLGDGLFVHDLELIDRRVLHLYWAPGVLVAKRLAGIIHRGAPKMPKKAFDLPPPSIIDPSLKSWEYGQVYATAKRLKARVFEYGSYGRHGVFQYKEVCWMPFQIYYPSRRRDWKTEQPIGIKLNLKE